MESSRTHYEVFGLVFEVQFLGLVLEASELSKMPCPQSSTIFWLIKLGQGQQFFFSLSWRTPKTSRKIYEDLFFKNAWNSAENLKWPFFWRTLARCILSLWPWLRVFLSLSSELRKVNPWPWSRALCPRLNLWNKCSDAQTLKSHDKDTKIFFWLKKES